MDRLEAGNTYTYVGTDVPEVQESRQGPKRWVWGLLLAPLLVLPFLVHHTFTQARVEDAAQDYTVHVHHVHHYHSGHVVGGIHGVSSSIAGASSIDGSDMTLGSGSDIDGVSSIDAGSDFGGASTIDTGSDFDGASTIDTGSDFDGASTIDTGSDFDGGSTIDTGSDFDGASSIDAGSDIGASTITSGSDVDGVSSISGSAIGDANIIEDGSGVSHIGGVSTVDGDIDGLHTVRTVHTVHHAQTLHPIIHTVHHGTKEIVVKHHYLTKEKDIHVTVPIKGPDHVVVDKVYSPHAHFSCSGLAGSTGGEFWSPKHRAWCCWKFQIGCATHVVNQDKYIHVTKTHAVPVPHYYKVPVPSAVPKPIVVKTPIPSEPLPPKHVMVPVPVPGEIPPPVVHYKYQAVPKPYKVKHVVYEKQHVPVPVTVKKYVKEYVPEDPEVIYKTHHVVVNERGYDCDNGMDSWKDLWDSKKQRFCCWKVNIGCPETHYKTRTHVKTRVKYVKVPVPTPPKIIVRRHVAKQELQSFDCSQGFSNWWKGWSPLKKTYCCAHEHRGCPGMAHGHFHVTVHASGGAAAGGKTYDCDAGFAGWMQGWSDSKKTWCCAKMQRGCVEHHCFTGAIASWGEEKRDWCCKNHQRGCAHTTFSPLGCDAVCVVHGESSTCKDRMQWVQENVFTGKDDSCNLAYSKVQVDCDICRGCSAAAAGCHAVTGVATSAAFDCNAALNNFHRAWSPPKKQWCCGREGKGCEGSSPPGISAGAGMMWKHVQVNGFWTWTAVHSGASATALPYDCHAGLANWKLGWSSPKKAWCCSKQHMGCPGSAGGTGAGMSGSWSATWSSAHGHALPPSMAGSGMQWSWSGDHWVQQHMSGAHKFHCHAQMGSVATWSEVQKHWCCVTEGIGC